MEERKKDRNNERKKKKVKVITEMNVQCFQIMVRITLIVQNSWKLNWHILI